MRASQDGMEMLRMIDDDNFKTALITGCPGSGKTTVSIYRLVRLNNQQARVQLVTFHNMLVLAIRNLADVQRVDPDRISTFHRWYCPLTDSDFDVKAPPSSEEISERLESSPLERQRVTEMMIDEGQDLPLCVYEALPRYFTRLFVGADNGQQVHRDYGAEVEDIESALQNLGGQYRRFSLGRNFRNTYETYAFARQFIPRDNLTAWDPAILERLSSFNRRGPKPTAVSYEDVSQRNEHLRVTLENAEGNVAVLCPLADSPEMHSGESVEGMHALVTGMGIVATKYHNRTRVPDNVERYIVTTFRSAKGMEFDVVVIPRINFFRQIPEEWYVACTRARRQLFVYRDLTSAQCDPISSFDPQTYEVESAESRGAADDWDVPL